jgi:hypothetical protein
MALAVDTHPQREKIIDALMRGIGCKTIAKTVKPKISPVSIWRYQRDKLKPALARATEAGKSLVTADIPDVNGLTAQEAEIVKRETVAALDADPFIARVQKHEAVLDAAITRTGLGEGEAFDPRALASLIGADVKRTELWARLAGRLDAPQSQSHSIVVVMPQSAIPPGPSMRQIEAADVIECKVIDQPDLA